MRCEHKRQGKRPDGSTYCRDCGWNTVRPWTPERRERVGRAVHAKHRAGAQADDAEYVPSVWDRLSQRNRDCYCDQGEAAVRADEEGR